MLEIKRLPDGASFDVEFLGIGSIPESPKPHRHEYFEIFWILSGNGRQSIDFVEYEMSPNKMFFITPGQVHDVHELSDNIYAISFNAEFINSQVQSQLPIDKLFLQNRSEKPYIVLDEQGNKDLSNLIKIIENEFNTNSSDKDLMSMLLVSFLRYVMRYLESEVRSYSLKDTRMVKLLKLIDEHFHSRKDASFYAEQLAMTNKRLNELSKEQFGHTVTQLIHDKIIVEARRMLAFTDKTIKAIGLELGYEDTSYFGRFYKRLSGTTPQQFREKWFSSNPQ
jgi:AraC-like DNA-binding protein